MRSLRYLLTDRPRNLDDCFEHVRSSTPCSVKLSLATNQFVGELFLVAQHVATFTWQFEDCEVACEKVLAGRLVDDSTPAQDACIAKANRKLEHLLERMMEVGVVVEGDMERFLPPRVDPRRKQSPAPASGVVLLPHSQ